MTWKECLDLGPTRLSRALGCPVTTASSWINQGGPPEWMRPILARVVADWRAHERTVELVADVKARTQKSFDKLEVTPDLTHAEILENCAKMRLGRVHPKPSLPTVTTYDEP